MEVVDSPFRAGDLRHGYQAVADNLPNDPRIHAAEGFEENLLQEFSGRARGFDRGAAGRKADAARAGRAGHAARAYLTDTLLHEISHGLGPAFARRGGKQVDIREALGPHFPGVEEAKADLVGLLAAEWLAGRGVLAREQLDACYAAHVADLFRMLRFGTAEAHAVSEIMQFSYLVERKAITWDAASSRYAVNLARHAGRRSSELARELLEIEATGDAARAGKWFARYQALPPGTANALAAAAGLPVDIDPVFAFPRLPR